jgi:hypothetical protein
LIGPNECRVVNANVIKKVLRPLGRPYRLQNDGIALPTDGHGFGFKTEFLRQRN